MIRHVTFGYLISWWALVSLTKVRQVRAEHGKSTQTFDKQKMKLGHSSAMYCSAHKIHFVLVISCSMSSLRANQLLVSSSCSARDVFVKTQRILCTGLREVDRTVRCQGRKHTAHSAVFNSLEKLPGPSNLTLFGSGWNCETYSEQFVHYLAIFKEILQRRGFWPRMQNAAQLAYRVSMLARSRRVQDIVITSTVGQRDHVRRSQQLQQKRTTTETDDLDATIQKRIPTISSCKPVGLLADDIDLIAESPGGLQKIMNQVSESSNRFELKINQKKTKTMPLLAKRR